MDSRTSIFVKQADMYEYKFYYNYYIRISSFILVLNLHQSIFLFNGEIMTHYLYILLHSPLSIKEAFDSPRSTSGFKFLPL